MKKISKKYFIVITLIILVLACTWIGLSSGNSKIYSTTSDINKVVKECVVALKEE